MAMVCKLVNGDSEAATVNLLSGPDPEKGWRIMTWNPQVGLPVLGTPDASVTERLDLMCDAEDHDDLALHFQALDEMRRWAAAYRTDQTVSSTGSREAVWFHVKMDDESNERRALVNEIRMQWRTQQISESRGAPESRVQVRMELVRQPWWESTTSRYFPALPQNAAACVTYDHTGGITPHDIVGDMPARIKEWPLWTEVGAAKIGRLWAGLRSVDKHGTPGNFVPIWECEDTDATLGTDATREPDATASPTGGGDTMVTITPGTATWAKRLTIRLKDITANDEDNLGFFLWLLRYKLSAGSSTWELHLRFGYFGMADDDFKRGPIIEVANSSWDYVELAGQALPVRGRFYVTQEEGDNAVQVWARRTSGAANLDLDCLIPLPADEGWLKITGVDLDAAATEYLGFSEKPDGMLEAVEYRGGAVGIQALGVVDAWHFRLPVGDGRTYIVYAGPTSSDITDNGIRVIGSTGAYIERWANLRGAS